MFPPSGLSSWVVTSPRISLSTEKNISRPHSSILLSLKKPSKSLWNNVLLNHLPNKHVNVIHFCGWKCSLLTWSTWASCRTPDRWIPGLWEPEVYSRCACKMAERSRCLWTSHETGPDREKMTIILPVFKNQNVFVPLHYKCQLVSAMYNKVYRRTIAMNRPMNLKYLRWSGLMEEAGFICRQ